MGLGETSVKWRCSFLLQFIGFFCAVAGVASSYFADAELIPNKFKHIGFWDVCDDTQTYSCRDVIEYLNNLSRDSDWVYGCRAMGVLGIIFMGLTLLVSVWMAYMASGIHIGNLITAIGDFVSVIFSLIGVLVFTFNAQAVLEEELEMDSDPSWSFAVFIIACGLYFFAGLLQIFEACTAE